jgi:hypothetical protein
MSVNTEIAHHSAERDNLFDRRGSACQPCAFPHSTCRLSEGINMPSVDRSETAPFFVASAVMEVGAGLALLAVPTLVIALVFGTSGTETGVAIGRLAGAALLALGASCWWARHDRGHVASRALMSGMLIYNTAVVALVVAGSLGPRGPLLWAVALLHGAMALWCLKLLRVVR